MADEVRVTGLTELIADLGKTQAKALPAVEAVVEKGAVNIKKDWAQRWTGLSHAPALANTINYDMYHTLGVVGAEIGADKEKRQGGLANLIEYGSKNNAPHPGGSPALDAESPRFERALEDAGFDVLDKP